MQLIFPVEVEAQFAAGGDWSRADCSFWPFYSCNKHYKNSGFIQRAQTLSRGPTRKLKGVWNKVREEQWQNAGTTVRMNRRALALTGTKVPRDATHICPRRT